MRFRTGERFLLTLGAHHATEQANVRCDDSLLLSRKEAVCLPRFWLPERVFPEESTQSTATGLTRDGLIPSGAFRVGEMQHGL